MPSGIIEFFTYWGKPVEDNIYQSANHRRRIMRTWEQMYGDKFRKGYIHITPDEELLINDDWTNATIVGKRNSDIMSLKGKLPAANIAAKFKIPISHVYAVHSRKYKNTCG